MRYEHSRLWADAWGRALVATTLSMHAAACAAEPAGTGEAAARRVRAVEIAAPAGASVLVGDSLRLVARALDSTGAAVSGVPLTWRAITTAATVSGNGLVFGAAPGIARIAAEANAVADTVEVTVQERGDPALTPGFNNEPAGMTLISDESFTSFPGSWSYQPKQSLARQAEDPTAPIDDKVLEFVFPQGFSGGGFSPAAIRPPSPPIPDPRGTRNFREVYWGFHFKASPNWQNHQSNINKILFGWTNNTTTFGLTWHWGRITVGGRVIPKHLALFQGGTYTFFNTPAAFSVEPGSWYKVELLYRPSSVPGRADGQLRIWVNDVLCAQHTSLVTSSGYISDLYFDPDWGGVGQVAKSHDDYMRIAHTRLSVR